MQVVRSTDWYFCIKNQELIYLDGKVVVIQTRLARCLEALILHAGETISYDELLLKVWKTEHRDSSTISSVIAELRKLINCRKNGPTYIKTVPKRGYCFVGSVEFLELSPQQITLLKNPEKPDAASLSAAQPQVVVKEDTTLTTNQPPASDKIDNLPSSQPKPGVLQTAKKWPWLAAGALLFMMVLIAVFWFSQSQQPKPPAESLYDNLHIYTYEPGLELEFDVSVSGEWMVYAHQNSLSTPKTIILKNLLSNKVFYYDAISDESVYSPSFSPVSNKIVFIKSTDEECQVRTIEFSESGFTTDTDEYLSSCGLSRIWTTTTFSADGNNVFFSRSKSLADPLKIIKLNLETGFERQITSPATSGRGDYSFSLSPDGEKLAIVRNHLWKSSNIMVLELDSEEIAKVQSLPYLILGVGWKDHNTLLYVDSEKRLVEFDLSANVEKSIISNERLLNYPVVRSNRIFASRGDILDYTIWSFPISEDPTTMPTPFIDTPYKDQAPVATKNGIYFISDRTGKNQIWLQNEMGLSQISSFNEPNRITEIVYAPAYERLIGLVNHRLFSLDLDTQKLTYLSESSGSIKNFTLSSDGHQLLYALEEEEIWSIYRYDIEAGTHEYLLRGFSVKSLGNKLYFTKLRETGLWEYNLVSKTEELIVNLNDFKATQFWHITKNYLIYIADSSVHFYSFKESRELWKADLDNRSKNLSCYNATNTCYLEQSSSGNTEIIELRKNKEF
ncbi:winged helix-turn-helix domain-containing protein [Alteromonas ponticola]|uniref:OmpR/PhoB-type domain-containing protein n=1 Tax=Alteromonas ponticola TaxID=2720613 RepID=A0ABX1R167_9ALTE|nr:winged helix-turn-helix domain-containing protein [Alteromonas ponticola]NMH59829.1 hypothetical protein [Alteromonas ponticola]